MSDWDEEDGFEDFDAFDEDASEGSFSALMSVDEEPEVVHIKKEEAPKLNVTRKKPRINSKGIIVFYCEQCTSKLTAKREQQGRKLRCPSCKHVQRAPQIIESHEDFVRGSDPDASLHGIYLGQHSKTAAVVRCPSCWQKTPVHVRSMGKKMQCPKCKEVFRIPYPPSPESEITS